MHTHSHYLLFLIGLRHCRKLVPKICQLASTQMFQKENQVSIPRFTSLARGDRSADQCLLSAAPPRENGPSALAQIPAQRALLSAGLAWPASSPASQSSSRRSPCCSHLHSPWRALWALPKPRPVNPKSLWASLTPSAQTYLTPEPQWDTTHNTHDQSLWAPHKSPSTILSDTSASSLISTLYSMALQKKTAEIPAVEKTEKLNEQNLSFFPHARTPSLSWQHHWQQKTVLQKGKTDLNRPWSTYLITNRKQFVVYTKIFEPSRWTCKNFILIASIKKKHQTK